MSKAAPVIIWFRQDLRIADNPALSHASQTGVPVIAVYILDETVGVRAMGAASRWWLDKSLRSHAEHIHARFGGRLILRRGPALAILKDLIDRTGATSVFWNRLHDKGSIAHDTAIKNELTVMGVTSRSFNAALLKEPWEVAKADGGDYRVFTPYWRVASAAVDGLEPAAAPARADWRIADVASEDIDDWRLHPAKPDWSKGFSGWDPGEAGALERLEGFLSEGIAGYAHGRDLPAEAATSRLSPHLHFGEIGPRRVYTAATMAAGLKDTIDGDVEAFHNELGWREFNHHVLFHHSDLATRNFRDRFDDFPWRQDPSAFKAWRRGLTGYPIVDAGMRELWTTGWMHNRVRMITASFLTKHLLIDWRQGEAWFWDTLVDADLANNVANWQWVAGSGADAAPYFRIFNPVLQGAKYDPHGVYVRRWLPELSKLPDLFIHRPWEADETVLRAAGVCLGVNYPSPIIDHAVARDRALAAYRRSGGPLPSGRADAT